MRRRLAAHRQVGLRGYPATSGPLSVLPMWSFGPRSPALVSGEVLPAGRALLPLPRSQQADPGFVAIFAPSSPRAC